MQYNVQINRKMMAKKSDKTYEECMEVKMSPAQKEVFLIIDEWWKKYGYSPSIRDIAHVRGKMGLGNTLYLVLRLVDLGVIKKIDKRGRTIRPTYINFRNLE
jgi:sulfur relay (sulfurtransferase) DsrC/TusE family protein